MNQLSTTPAAPTTFGSNPASKIDHTVQANGGDTTMENGEGKMNGDAEIISLNEGSPSNGAPQPISYNTAVASRNSQFIPTPSPSPLKSYVIESVYTIPHSSPIHALHVPPCSSHIYSGGPDGMVRRYNLSATLNGVAGVENPNLLNLTGKSAERAIPVLVGYWENEEEGEWCDTLSKDVKWGKKFESIGKLSPIHSLAIQSQELWGLSGTAGSINLFTIRHDQGQIRHVFRSSTTPSLGHRPNSPVSAMQIFSDESSLLSGGWDNSILEWDLNTGVAARHYDAHSGQITSISFRPLESAFTPSTVRPRTNIHHDKTDDVMDEDMAFPASTSTLTKLDAESSAAAPLPLLAPESTTSIAIPTLIDPPVIQPEGEGKAKLDQNSPESEDDPLFDSEADADADGDEDDDIVGADSSLMAGLPPSSASRLSFSTTLKPFSVASSSNPRPVVSSTIPLKVRPIVEVPMVGSEEERSLPALSSDVFMSTSIDGKVMIWDRRIKSGAKGGVRRLNDIKSKIQGGNWCTSATWSSNPNQIIVGRRSSTIEIHDLRYSTPSSPFLQVLRLPPSSGPVSSVTRLGSDGRFIISGSEDNLRIWDLELARELQHSGRFVDQGRSGFKIIPGHHGGTISALHVDPRNQFLISASSNRGWDGNSTENLIVHDIKAIY